MVDTGNACPPVLRHRDERTVVAVDLVESVRMMELDEEGTVGAWQAFVAFIERQVLPPCEGRLVKSTGDGLVLEFADAAAAIHCAQDLLAVARRTTSVSSGAAQLRLRIGGHVGRIFIDQHDIHGRAVNLAARLMSIATPGDIVVSAELRDRLASEPDLDIEDLGPCYLKHLSGPVRAYRVRSSDGLVHGAPAAPPVAVDLRPVVAVIPFEKVRGDDATWAIGDALAQVCQLSAPFPTSSAANPHGCWVSRQM